MKKIFFSTLACCFFSLIALQASHGTILVGDSLDLVANGWAVNDAQKDKLPQVNELVDDYDGTVDFASILLPYPLSLLGKWEDGGWEDINPGFTGDFVGDNGSWAAPAGWASPLYYSIKSSTAFALYYVDDGSLSGRWDTATDLTGQDLSHISFWTARISPVPEPATLFLFGTGLIGLASSVMRRKVR